MDSTTVGLLSLVLGLIGAIVGAFAYLVGDIRKMGASAKRDLDIARESLLGRIEALARGEAQERNSLRLEFVSANNRVETDLRKLSEQVVRREDMAQLEARITRSSDRLERKFDAIQSRLTGRPITTMDNDGT